MDSGYLGLFNIEYLSSVTAMVMAVNIITQIIKEVFLSKLEDKRIPKVVTLGASFFVVAMQHMNTFINNSVAFHNSKIELIFLIILNTFLITGLSMGNYKVLGLTKEKKVKKLEKINHFNGGVTKAELTSKSKELI